jgi:crotonobetainyl-CoA:carnitine CoA-transferase CaiB-like acyl-CoA transferase
MAESWLPLAGVKVVDFSMFVPGPFATAILADLGAEVIKVEAPRGDPGRSYVPAQFSTENRNKRSLAVDLKTAASSSIVERLAKQADIVVEGFRPGVAKRLGIDCESMMKHNGKIIYCSISGYGQTGPWRERPGHDVNYVAAAGALAFPGQWLKAPARSSLPVADMGGGAFAGIAILSALHEREKTGKGAYLDLSLFESAFFWAAMRHGLDPEVDPRAHIFPVNDVFETRDGKRLTLGILEEHFWQNFARCVPGFGGAEFSTDAKRRANGDVLSGLLAKTFMEKGAAEWLKLLGANDIPVDLCVTPGEAAEHVQLKERKAAQGGFALFPVWANGGRGASLRRGVPKLGEHTREVLVELGFDDADISDFIKSKVVLS